MIVRVAGALLALPVERVIETMRPLAIEPTGRPGPLLGTAQIRGARCAVVDVAALLEAPASADAPADAQLDGRDPARFVVVRGARAPIALRVDAVVDVRAIDQHEPVSKSAARSTYAGDMTLDAARDALSGAGWLQAKEGARSPGVG